MRFDEIKSRITGFSCPVLGISWQPPESDITIARRVITFLEDRRVLYAPEEMETPRYCEESVQQIRGYLTEELQRIPADKDLAKCLRAMRKASREFITSVQTRDAIMFANQYNHWASWHFYTALGKLRGVFGVYVSRLAAQYGLDIEDSLAAIIPFADDQDVADE
ncbi:MAG: hypothetical protein M1305_03315 [Candidatus Marsarchaeota archaeon]|nr:hypothetical protein [Candidatus Marsarchaeota archaeon]